MMSSEEVMMHMRMGEYMKHTRQGLHIMSFEQYERLRDALFHYLDTGEIFEGEFGLERRT